MRILGLCSYPIEAAATRFRMAQFVEPLAARGIELEIHPFLNSHQFSELYKGGGLATKSVGMLRSLIGRLNRLPRLRKYDLIFVQREAMIFGPAIFEWLYQTIGKLPMVLDLDDATYIRYVSPKFGRLGSALKFFGKTDRLIKRSSVVICGNRYIAEHVESLGTNAIINPTVVDTNIFCPVEKHNDPPVIGWIGTHSTFPLLESIFPALEKLAGKYHFVLKIVGAGEKDIRIKGVQVLNLEWSLDREVEDFQTLDIGLYPIALSGSANEEWIAGKSGFKAIQYMAVGMPFVMSPVGVCAEVGDPGKTHLNASREDEWCEALTFLLESKIARDEMGQRGREFAVDNYTVGLQADQLARAFLEIAAV
jgi:glycosyltransferase involved in cell wall biosynthesis